MQRYCIVEQECDKVIKENMLKYLPSFVGSSEELHFMYSQYLCSIEQYVGPVMFIFPHGKQYTLFIITLAIGIKLGKNNQHLYRTSEQNYSFFPQAQSNINTNFPSHFLLSFFLLY